jgi:F-type H+-transporting ATPase subunit b
VKLKSILWIATTPVALTVLLATTDVGGQATPESASHGMDASPGSHKPAEAQEHHVLTNPIQNFFNFSYAGKDDHGGTYEEGDHKMPPPFGMALINFAALIFIVGKFFAPGIAKMTRERHEQIGKDLAEGARLRDEAKRKLDDYNARLANMDREIDELVRSIRSEAEAERKRIVDEAEARAIRMQKDAESQIQAEMQRVRIELEREAVLQAIAAAEKILREQTTDADQKKLVDKFVNGLEAVAGRGRVNA